MNREQIMEAIKQLENSQGWYTHLYSDLCKMRETEPERFDIAMRLLEEQNFKDAVDLILYLES